MPLVNSKEMFEKAYNGGYAIGAFNCNNMEIVQAITEAAKECNSPVILQVSAGARKYAKPIYLKKMVEAAVEDTNLPIVLHLDHGADFEMVSKTKLKLNTVQNPTPDQKTSKNSFVELVVTP